MGILEKIKDIEAEIARTQKNKATEFHMGMLKARLAKLRAELIEPSKGGGAGKGEGFDVMKSGDARVALIGFPSVGKSTLLSTLTETESEAASYEFTTLTCIPGVIHYNDATIQLLDLPGIIEGAAKGRGRGRQVIAVARTADLILMMMEAGKAHIQKPKLEYELESVGIRLNKSPPDVTFTKKASGGIRFTASVPLTELNEEYCRRICQEYRIHNCEILIREDCTVDQFIDVIVGNRVYIPCLYGYNKVDTCTMEEINELAHQSHSCVLSANLNLNLDFLLNRIWKHLDMIRIYTKPKGKAPDLTEPVIMRKGSTVEHVCHHIHRDMVAKFKYALVWGTSAKHCPQRVGLYHELDDQDVVQIATK
jgi:small GTP-binding protein